MREIDEVLTRYAEGNGPKRPPKKLTPFNAAKRVMVIEDDRVTVCGIEVWKDCAQPHVRQALAALSRKEDGRFVRIRPTKIDRDLGRNASNPIASRMKNFRDRASEVLAEAGYECGPEDIIAAKTGGYCFQAWMDVRTGKQPPTRPPSSAPTHKATEQNGRPILNDRKKWVLQQIENCRHISQKDVTLHFRGKLHASTIKRDLKELRDGGQIETHPDGYYVRVKGTARSGVDR
jgi:hypothetical protein